MTSQLWPTFRTARRRHENCPHFWTFVIDSPGRWLIMQYFDGIFVLTRENIWTHNRVACNRVLTFIWRHSYPLRVIYAVCKYVYSGTKCPISSVYIWHDTCDMDYIRNVNNQYFQTTLNESSCMKRTCVHPRSSNMKLYVFKKCAGRKTCSLFLEIILYHISILDILVFEGFALFLQMPFFAVWFLWGWSVKSIDRVWIIGNGIITNLLMFNFCLPNRFSIISFYSPKIYC